MRKTLFTVTAIGLSLVALAVAVGTLVKAPARAAPL